MNPILLEEIRKAYQKKLDMVNEVSKHQNRVVANFLFKNAEEEAKKEEKSGMDFMDSDDNAANLKP